jgi:hypothetical protein
MQKSLLKQKRCIDIIIHKEYYCKALITKGNNMFRVYEAVNNTGKKFKERGHFKTLDEAKDFAFLSWLHKHKSTFIVNYENEKGEIIEESYGDWHN